MVALVCCVLVQVVEKRDSAVDRTVRLIEGVSDTDVALTGDLLNPTRRVGLDSENSVDLDSCAL